MNSPNRLIGEKSPYLLQHARNPVDWYPWGDEAFAEARGRDVPVFLSIGYSTCHWCHVMERESFEDPSIAALLNESFVCIKVDREERPDIDRVYMTALQAMGQNGGWPMTMFLTPDRKPFYGGTYFPPESRYGRAGLPEVVRRIRRIWDTEREKAEESARSVTTYLEDVGNAGGAGDRPDAGILDTCYDQIASTYDAVHGGFGAGPKFPRPVVFDFLLRYAARTRRDAPRAMVQHTLRSMASGGMYDQIGGGFHRYSVDGAWRVPHFEKMLYDQAQLVHSYLNTFLISRDAGFAAVARETVDYVLRDMTDPEGGFYSAEDADSPRPEHPEESGEGAFYVWEKKEIDAALGSASGLFNDYFGVEEEGNVPVDPQHEFTGRNILYRKASSADATREPGIGTDALYAGLAASRKILFELRARRPRPLRDDKILTSWNGLMIGACARAGQVLGEPRYIVAASRAAGFVATRMRDTNLGVLYRRYRDGEARIEGQLEDYAFFVSGLLDLFASSGEGRWLAQAVQLTEEQIRMFHDSGRNGFFETTGNDGSLPVRLKEQYDGAEPSGNSVTVMNLARLSRLIDRPEWGMLASETVATFGATLRARPAVLPMMAAALEFLLAPPRQIVIVGPADDRRTAGLTAAVHARFLPTTTFIRMDPGEGGEAPRRLNRFLGSLGMRDGKPTAYVCHNFVCDLPVTEPEALAVLLDGATISGKAASDAGAGLPAPSL